MSPVLLTAYAVIVFATGVLSSLMFVHNSKLVKLLTGCAYFGFYGGAFVSAYWYTKTSLTDWLIVFGLSFVIGVAVYAANKLIRELHSGHILDGFE